MSNETFDHFSYPPVDLTPPPSPVKMLPSLMSYPPLDMSPLMDVRELTHQARQLSPMRLCHSHAGIDHWHKLHHDVRHQMSQCTRCVQTLAPLWHVTLSDLLPLLSNRCYPPFHFGQRRRQWSTWPFLVKSMFIAWPSQSTKSGLFVQLFEFSLFQLCWGRETWNTTWLG